MGFGKYLGEILGEVIKKIIINVLTIAIMLLGIYFIGRWMFGSLF